MFVVGDSKPVGFLGNHLDGMPVVTVTFHGLFQMSFLRTALSSPIELSSPTRSRLYIYIYIRLDNDILFRSSGSTEWCWFIRWAGQFDCKRLIGRSYIIRVMILS